MTPLQQALKLYMAVNAISAREIQRQTGIEHTAISRFCQGKDIVLSNFSRLLNWMLATPQSKEGEQE